MKVNFFNLTTEAQRSQCALAVPRLVRAASPLGEATGATQRQEKMLNSTVLISNQELGWA
ncbi:hypothetical protein [Nostoc sp.]|uniref:hypothetical protein n=1 Tax=Nostoc sp. TaxID=1180 RepID=UPI002FF86AF6